MSDLNRLKITRRHLFALLGRGGAAAAVVMGSGVINPSTTHADGHGATMRAIKQHMGAEDYTQSSMVKIDAPIIAENGSVVPIKVTVDYPMEADNYIEKIALFVDNNPTPFASSYTLSPANGKAYVSARLKIGKTSQVRAVARTNSGRLIGTAKEVKVTIGGCGG
uniref:Putative Thiosulfate-binding protein SoxY n=1 Tax=Magnetococcus massalia (strain MO-1) TaxID=451514 RepID=A0A1S7LLM3_MAGMO|nr:putative Thiosulfate-binding protein SoxY [Candidatus Magnetococcus massalia]